MSDQWGLVIGSWGDVLCATSHFVDKVGCGGVVHYGRTPVIKDFLAEQPFVSEARWVRKSEEIDSLGREERVEAIMAAAGVRQQPLSVQFGQGIFRIKDTSLPPFPSFRLPAICEAWASEFVGHATHDLYLVQPFSFQSQTRAQHWPGWEAYLDWLVEDSGKQFVLCGMDWDSSRLRMKENVVDAVDKTPSVMHVFALADRVKGVITTNNSLAVWCAARGIDAIVPCTALGSQHDYYFAHRIKAPSSLIFSFDTRISTVTCATQDRFGIAPVTRRKF